MPVSIILEERRFRSCPVLTVEVLQAGVPEVEEGSASAGVQEFQPVVTGKVLLYPVPENMLEGLVLHAAGAGELMLTVGRRNSKSARVKGVLNGRPGIDSRY